MSLQKQLILKSQRHSFLLTFGSGPEVRGCQCWDWGEEWVDLCSAVFTTFPLSPLEPFCHSDLTLFLSAVVILCSTQFLFVHFSKKIFHWWCEGLKVKWSDARECCHLFTSPVPTHLLHVTFSVLPMLHSILKPQNLWLWRRQYLNTFSFFSFIFLFLLLFFLLFTYYLLAQSQ